MDTQVVEILGRQRLIAELLSAKLEVATPARDRGIDLLAYADLGHQVATFAANPIQMKASSVSAFSVSRKYDRFADLILAYVWHLSDPAQAVTYAMTHPQAVQLAKEQGWTNTASWEAGAYTSNKPSAKLIELLEAYRMTSEKWWKLITGNDVPVAGG